MDWKESLWIAERPADLHATCGILPGADEIATRDANVGSHFECGQLGDTSRSFGDHGLRAGERLVPIPQSISRAEHVRSCKAEQRRQSESLGGGDRAALHLEARPDLARHEEHGAQVVVRTCDFR